MFGFLKKKKNKEEVVNDVSSKNLPTHESISINDIEGRDDINLIDVRTISEYKAGHIKRAKNIPKERLIKTAKLVLDVDQTYYIMCKSGARSADTCNKLFDMGYSVVNLEGGYDGYFFK